MGSSSGDDDLSILFDDFGGREDGAGDEFGEGGGGGVDDWLGEEGTVIIAGSCGRETGLDGFVGDEKGSCWLSVSFSFFLFDSPVGSFSWVSENSLFEDSD